MARPTGRPRAAERSAVATDDDERPEEAPGAERREPVRTAGN
jgi:hypothetical protein